LIGPIGQILKILANSRNSLEFSANLLIFQILVFPDVLENSETEEIQQNINQNGFIGKSA